MSDRTPGQSDNDQLKYMRFLHKSKRKKIKIFFFLFVGGKRDVKRSKSGIDVLHISVKQSAQKPFLPLRRRLVSVLYGLRTIGDFDTI